MSNTDAQEPLSNLSDSSFVILSQGSLPPQENDISAPFLLSKTPISNSLNNSRSTFSVLESTKSSADDKFQSNLLDGSSVSEINIQKKLNELVKENYQLKETLSQNNLAIKSQLDRFFMWQQEVLKTHETHKEKFLETKDLILKLRSENAILKKQLEDSLLDSSFLSSSNTYAEIHKKPKKFDDAVEVKEFDHMCHDLVMKNEKLCIENQTLKDELEAAKKENSLLQQKLEAVERENQFLEKKTLSLPENKSYKSLPNSEARAQICNLLKQLEEEKSKVLRLKEKLKNCKPNLELCTSEESKNYTDNLDNMNISVDMQNHRCSSLQSWVSVAEENDKKNQISEGMDHNLISEIKEFKGLDQKGDVTKEKEESLEDLKKQFNKLLEDYKALQAELTSVKKNESLLEKYRDELFSLSHKLASKDKELISKQQECDELNETIKKLNLECEEIVILRVQAQQFQADFNEERAEREKLAEKKEEMAEQIRYFQMRIQTLEQSSSNNIDSVQSPLESPGRKSHYLCPKCSFAFSDLKACEEHINDCLNLEFQT